jgi:TniQ
MNTPLCLRVVPPYVGETITSFIERASAFYAIPYPSLVAQLVDEDQLRVGRRDMDLQPSQALCDSLKRCVPGWISPLDSFKGFCGMLLGMRHRLAYCPLCFRDDIEAGRTPYFRYDWIPFFVTVCWDHRTPLFTWGKIDADRRRSLPNAWIYRTDDQLDGSPDFFVRHYELATTIANKSLRSEMLDSTRTKICLLEDLQLALEKRACDAVPELQSEPLAKRRLRAWANELILDAGKLLWGAQPFPMANTERSWDDESFEPVLADPLTPSIRFTRWHLQKTASLQWRRTYLLFAARTLAAVQPVGALIRNDQSKIEPWQRYWDREIWPSFRDRPSFLVRIALTFGERYAPPQAEVEEWVDGEVAPTAFEASWRAEKIRSGVLGL